ncbi:hypothetical protein VCV18_008134 [Metarhizium anisopliae]
MAGAKGTTEEEREQARDGRAVSLQAAKGWRGEEVLKTGPFDKDEDEERWMKDGVNGAKVLAKV